ncbi:MAG: GerMN domain-containing protein [Candidatus Omnitrophota bacterium]
MDIRALIILLLVILLIGSLGTVYYLYEEVYVPAGDRPAPNAAAKPNAAIPGNLSIEVEVYYLTEDQQQLAVEKREIAPTNSITERIEVALQFLLRGPLSRNLISPIPKGTQLESIFWSEPDGRVYISFSKELLAMAPGHGLSEWATIYSIVNTAAAQSTAVKDVFILVGGAIASQQNNFNTLWDWSLPFRPDHSLVLNPVQSQKQ